ETILSQLLYGLVISMASLVLEFTLRQRLAAELQQSDAESMVSGFRAVLRGVCDGELLLDGKGRIQEGMGALQHLLSKTYDLKGTAFAELLVKDGEERGRFEDFISRRSDASQVCQGAPQGLRMSLCSHYLQRV
ncbi:ISA3, partial [Symbiodinium pilosum]